MKKMTRLLNLLVVTLVLFAGAYPASALQLLDVSPVLNPETGGGGHPTWYQDQNSIAIKPSGIPLTGFPTGFPPEWFYYMLASDAMPMGNADVDVSFFLEASWIDQQAALVTTPATTLNLPIKAMVFQRMRMKVKPNAPLPGGDPGLNTFATGNYRVDHPWGTTTFFCQGPGGNNSACQETTDIPGGFAIDPATGNIIGGGFVGAKGIAAPNAGTFTGFDKFAKAANATPGFLGDGVTAGQTISSAGVTPLLRNNIVVTDPLGNVATINGFTVQGATIGLELHPLGAIDFGVVKSAPGALTKIINVHNLTGTVVPITPAAIVPGSNPVVASPDFTIAPTAGVTGCPVPPATLAIGATCDLDVIFSPTGADGARTATITIVGGGTTPPAQTTVIGTADGTAPALTLPTTGFTKFSKTATQPISGTVTDVNGVAGVTVTIDGGTPAPATVDAAAGTWSFVVPALTETNPVTAHTIVVVATDKALSTAVASPGGNVATVNDPNNTITVDSIPPAVNITAPVDGIFTTNKTPALTFTATDLNNPLSIVTVDGGTPITPTPAALGPLADGQHSVVVATTDSAGNITTHTNTFTVDTIAPVITVTTPLVTAAGTIGVTSPVLTFPIAETNLDPAKTVVMLDGVLVPNPVSGSTILGPFVPGVLHTLTIDAADLALSAATQKTVSFTLLLSDGSINSLGATAPTIADVITALKISIGGFSDVAAITVNTDAFKHGDVAPLVNGVPAPDGNIGIGDALTILKKVVGITTF